MTSEKKIGLLLQFAGFIFLVIAIGFLKALLIGIAIKSFYWWKYKRT